jgi:glyoxylase-like metal-dependent hydrolase (beta-lactamase superfamily II)
VPAVLHQIEAYGIDMAQVNKILILHAHFDHVGIVPYLKRLQPDIEIYASERAWEILSMPKAISTINDFNRAVTEQMGMVEACSPFDLDWRDDISGIGISEGEEMKRRGIHHAPSVHTSPDLEPFSLRIAVASPLNRRWLPREIPILPSSKRAWKG